MVSEMKHTKKRNIYRIWLNAVCIIFSSTVFLSGCSTQSKNGAISNVPHVSTTVLEENEYGSAVLTIGSEELLAAGFTYGDTVDVKFENGKEYNDIPFFNGYYNETGKALLLIYPGDEHPIVAINYGTLCDEADVSAGMGTDISLHEKGKAADIQELSEFVYSNNRDDYESDEKFVNAREIRIGKLLPEILYRSASPFDNEKGRAPYASEYAKQHGIVTVLNLADDENTIAGYTDMPEYSGQLLDAGNVILAQMTTSYTSDEFGDALRTGLEEMSGRDGPYLVHCLEGKDRTGFVCMVLGALSGATAEELEDDYMVTYLNYYDITKKDTERYNLIYERYFLPMLTYVLDTDDVDISEEEIEKRTETYLKKIGMEESSIKKLKYKLTGMNIDSLLL